MPLHHTEDPGVRAADIAHSEEMRVWRETGDARLSDQVGRTTYRQALAELSGLPPVMHGIDLEFQGFRRYSGSCHICEWFGTSDAQSEETAEENLKKKHRTENPSCDCEHILVY